MTTTNYTEQAEQFLTRNGIKCRITLSDSKPAPWADKAGQNRHHYRVKLSKKNTTLRQHVSLVLGTKYSNRITFDFWGSIADAKAGKSPTPYDVLSCISGDVHCPDTFKDFCAEYGDSEDSIKALQTFRRCSAFARRLKAFFTSAELEQLSEIN